MKEDVNLDQWSRLLVKGEWFDVKETEQEINTLLDSGKKFFKFTVLYIDMLGVMCKVGTANIKLSSIDLYVKEEIVSKKQVLPEVDKSKIEKFTKK